MSVAPTGTDLETLRGKSVFVTGHTGFMGTWLSLWLNRLGARVSGYALAPPTDPSNFVTSSVFELITVHHQSDVRDARWLAAALRASNPDVVFHLAAQPLVRESYRIPRETFEINVGATANLLEAVRLRNKPCVVVIVTSDKCYHVDGTDHRLRETDRLGGRDPYSASKAAAELVVGGYRQSFFPVDRLDEHGVQVATVRAGNVIGGGDFAADRLVPDIVSALASERPVVLRHPQAVRPWQHVLEPLGGCLTLAAHMLRDPDPRWCEAFNFGPRSRDEVTVEELVTRFIEAWGEGTWEPAEASDAPLETGVLRLDSAKAIEVLGWSPRWTLDEAIHRAAGWYLHFAADPGGSTRGDCIEDIEAYVAAGDGPA